jgi:hypothetical protein
MVDWLVAVTGILPKHVPVCWLVWHRGVYNFSLKINCYVEKQGKRPNARHMCVFECVILNSFVRPLTTLLKLDLCVTTREFAGSIPNGVTGILLWQNPSDRTMTMESKGNEYQGCLLGIKVFGKVGLITLPPWFEFWEPWPPGTLRACPGIASLYV